MSLNHMLRSVEDYYAAKLRKHGPTPLGVDWNSAESQILRFEQLLRVCDVSASFSIIDYGCGYGALVDYLAGKGLEFFYTGYDISADMINKAREIHRECQNCNFISDISNLSMADYTVASGIFNVKLQASDEEWHTYMLNTVERLATLSTKGFAFNALTSYSDPNKRRPDLYYADTLFWFDYCKKHFSRFVALLHDYPLYEFTILVKN